MENPAGPRAEAKVEAFTSPTSLPRPDREARRCPRVSVRGRCFAELGGGWEGSVVDLSVTGMLLRLTRVLTPGSSYFVKLYLGRQVAVVEAQVVRVIAGDDECDAGMEFRRVAPSDRALLQAFVDSAAQ